MPPFRPTPFSNSLIRGMRQTNNNIGNMGNPPTDFTPFGRRNPLKPGFETSPSPGAGIGSLLDNKFIAPGTSIIDDLTSPIGPGFEPDQDPIIWDVINNPIGEGHYLNPPNQDFNPFPERPGSKPRIPIGNIQSIPSGYGGPIGPGGEFDQSQMPTDELPEGWEWQYINGNWEAVEPEGYGGPIGPGPGGEDFFTGAGTVVDSPNLPEYQEGIGGALGGGDWLSKTDPMAAGFDVNNDGVVNALDASMAAEMSATDPFFMGDYQPDMQDYLEQFFNIPPGSIDISPSSQYSSWQDWAEQTGNQELYEDFLSQTGQAGIDAYGSQSQQAFLDNLMQYIAPSPFAPQEFTGGGGQAGQAAKRLYYPGTSGGFASIGSGIGGGQSMDELLKRFQG